MPPDRGSAGAVTARAVAGAFIWSLSGDALSKAALLVTTFLALRSLAPLLFAQIVGLQASALLAAVAWDCGVSSLVTREIAAGRVTIGQTLRWTGRVRVIMLPVWLASYVGGWLILERTDPPPAAAVVWIGMSGLVIGLQQVTLGVLRGGLEFRAAGLAMAVGRWVTAAFAAFALLPVVHGKELLVIALGIAFGETTTLALSALIVARLQAGEAGKGAAAQAPLAFGMALPFALTGLIQVAYNRVDVLLVAALSTGPALSAYAATSRVQDAMFLLPSAVATIVLPLAARLFAVEDGDPGPSRRLWLRTLAVAGLSSLAIAVAINVGGADLVVRVLGRAYADATGPIQIVAWSVPMVAFNSVLAAVVAGRQLAHYVTIAIGVAFAASFGLNVWLVPSLGAHGAALAATLREIPVAVVLGAAGWLSGLFGRPTANRGPVVDAAMAGQDR